MKKKIIFLQLFKQTRKEIVILNECIVGRDTTQNSSVSMSKCFLKTENLRKTFFLKMT